MKQKIIITGPGVHGVGYRPFLIALADEFDIGKFSVHNLEEDGKQVVIAKVDADETQLQAFINAVRSRKPKKAEVSGIGHEPFEGRVPSIVRTSMLSMNSQLAKGIDAIESMLEKQDETVGEIRDLRDDLVRHSNTERLERMEKDIRLIKSKMGIRYNPPR